MMRIFINGFGRIGRSVLRAYLLTPERWPGLQIVGINDIAASEMCAYLFEYDSVFGPWKGAVALQDEALVVDGWKVPLHRTSDLSTLDLSGTDLVMECTGRAEAREVAERGLQAGAARVLISGPSQAADVTVVLGANHAVLAKQRIVSNASCTTNALAPLARLIHENWGIVTGSMTTVHCYTGSQPTVDAPAADYPRSRAAALSMVPTTTSAALLLDRVLPDLAGRIVAQAVRVPVASVSCVDFHLVTEGRPSVEEVNAAFRAAAKSESSVIGATDRPLVSTDLRARAESVVMACPETKVSNGGMLRVFGWYDNEWGFSNRMLDMAVRMG
ncbi:type I glyceraldehyde-3-phosphate dehydrogenase [Tabrizicola sp.]|uniref:type I glyceraldehyde-3-phosphate dehydrogenase n=1 Tax=Tabrizicola sp. TaxID=2005166 RepID=UPI002732AACA|nr:glyceraldehyde 3-phosphate dehydrogenase NAD-binding domain-containing protein [Tabrizicola sp.]MDP3195560.1 glyceraldehyde 3-phosphate dehydrogenase NAD-binding domain-containing protein [Tabrizicola sp.]MDZ4069352.1 glyceraldehyde 3-phosphate dehydrogenase NAD-binding domain-containing protein [Tabrizicola sp.]